MSVLPYSTEQYNTVQYNVMQQPATDHQGAARHKHSTPAGGEHLLITVQ